MRIITVIAISDNDDQTNNMLCFCFNECSESMKKIKKAIVIRIEMSRRNIKKTTKDKISITEINLSRPLHVYAISFQQI